ncbi:nucleoside-diphosphate sugar epimerase [Oceanobacillus picturae]|uniref:Nucleoside-diphosphate sugar epimerase n=1 Tax=Oceanobacillus picturae TaxID=171693 RepID=A0A0U9H5J1_9BACI|nr:nucleoside-diphosphate sugar epimerase [Oceanobacillus picturae]
MKLHSIGSKYNPNYIYNRLPRNPRTNTEIIAGRMDKKILVRNLMIFTIKITDRLIDTKKTLNGYACLPQFLLLPVPC